MTTQRAFYMYMITFPHGKKYIGITSRSIKQRFAQHKIAVRNGSINRVHTAMRKYGVENVVVQEIATFQTWEEACNAEIAAIAAHDTYHTRGKGYNMTFGGEGVIRDPEEFSETVKYAMRKIISENASIQRAQAIAAAVQAGWDAKKAATAWGNIRNEARYA